MMKKIRIAGFLCGMAALALVAGIWAYYSSTNSIENKLQTMQYGNEMVEKFTPDTDWQPGEEVIKEVGVTNTGGYNLFVRIKMQETWKLSDNAEVILKSDDNKFISATAASAIQTSTTDGLTTGDESVVAKTLAASGWTHNLADGYWYYNTPLTPGATTNNLLEKITLAANADMGYYVETKYYTKAATKPENTIIGTDANTQWVVYTGEVPTGTTYTRTVSRLETGKTGYASADYVLTITNETLQGTQEAFTALSATWGSTPANVKTSWGVN